MAEQIGVVSGPAAAPRGATRADGDRSGIPPPAIVPLQPCGTHAPVFAVPGPDGDVFAYRALAERLGPDQPFYALCPPGLDGGSEPIDRVEDLAAYFAGQLLTFKPDGPFVLAGHCAGGPAAVHTAHLIARWGGAVDFVALFGCAYPPSHRRTNLRALLERVAARARAVPGEPAARSREYWSRLRQARLPARRRRGRPAATEALPAPEVDERSRRSKLEEITGQAVRRHTPLAFGGPVHLILPNRGWTRWPALPLQWRRHAPLGSVSYGPDACQWFNMLQPPFVESTAALFVQARDRGTLASDGTAAAVERRRILIGHPREAQGA